MEEVIRQVVTQGKIAEFRDFQKTPLEEVSEKSAFFMWGEAQEKRFF